MYGAIFEELNVLSFELYSIQHVRATALNLYSACLSYYCFWLSSFALYFSKASLVLFTGFAYIFFVNMELNCVFLIDLVFVIQLGICNDGLTEIEYYQLK